MTSRVAKPPVLRMNLGTDFSRVRSVAERVRRFLEENGCDDGARADCELAVVEGCNNAIKHAYPNGVRRPVFLEVQIEPSQIEMRIIDHGPGFVWPESVHLPDPENESGRGLYLIRVLMDYAAYLRGPEENVLMLRKHRQPG
jgi:anti-sigma regulatory factor (Ser/Thr protein kinase)